MRFKKFLNHLKNQEPILIPTLPRHGSHAQDQEPILIPTLPRHGSHAQSKTSIKESSTKEHPDVSKWIDHNDNHKHGEDSEEIAEKLHDHSLEDHEHYNSIREYTTDSSEHNHHLLHKAQHGISYSQKKAKEAKDNIRKNGTNPYDEDNHRYYTSVHNKHEKKTKELDSITSESKSKHEVHVYHGAGFHPGKLADKHSERHIKSPCYMSTSHDKAQALSFSKVKGSRHKHVLHIHVKKGQKVTPLLKHSGTYDEHEHLLHRNTTLKISKKPKVYSRGHQKVHVWKAHIVDKHEDK